MSAQAKPANHDDSAALSGEAESVPVPVSSGNDLASEKKAGIPAANSADSEGPDVLRPNESGNARHAPFSVTDGEKRAANDEKEPDEDNSNLVRRTVKEITGLMADVHEIREELLAYGIQFHMLNAMIELGVQDKTEQLKKMSADAQAASVREHGSRAVSEEDLERHLEAVITLEKDIRHARQVAKNQGINLQALNHLTQLIRLNPGDGGVQAINTFLAYAAAAGVPLDRVDSIRQQFKDEPKSVLPNIPRDDDDQSALQQWRDLAGNLLAGIIMTIVIIWMVL